MTNVASPTRPRRLTRASATGVVGEYTHAVTFQSDTDFAIIFGPNGVGKTRFLEVINALSHLDIDRLEELPFESAMLQFSDGWVLSVAHESITVKELQNRETPDGVLDDVWHDLSKRFGADVETEPLRTLQFQLVGPDGDTVDAPPIILKLQESEYVSDVVRMLRNYRMHTEWPHDLESERMLFAFDAHRTRRQRERHARLLRTIPDAIELFAKELDVRLIETQRLLTLEIDDQSGRPRETSRPTIEAYSNVVRQQLAHDLSENSRLGQRLDSMFPRKMLEAGESSRITEDEIRRRLAEQSAKRERIEQITPLGLGPALPLPAGPLTDAQRSVLELYLTDAEDKLSTFSSTVQKIDLLETIINARLLGKRLTINADHGIEITRERDGELIPLRALSSGEQHEIIMFFDLLFNVKEGGLVLIDEPEISLHIAWQQKFIEDVQMIASLVGFQFVIATHSPQIIEGFWPHAQRLGPEKHPFDGTER